MDDWGERKGKGTNSSNSLVELKKFANAAVKERKYKVEQPRGMVTWGTCTYIHTLRSVTYRDYYRGFRVPLPTLETLLVAIGSQAIRLVMESANSSGRGRWPNPGREGFSWGEQNGTVCTGTYNILLGALLPAEEPHQKLRPRNTSKETDSPRNQSNVFRSGLDDTTTINSS